MLAGNGIPGSRYLIETDLRFVDYKNFISSDYPLDKLGVDPQWTQTRMGAAGRPGSQPLTGTTMQAGNSAALLAGNNLTLQPTAL
ncbi:hypothetical protein NB709_000453 [Xanthomonas sacchari]|nr:hypothetical protein [Xanthomonas sacchari]